MFWIEEERIVAAFFLGGRIILTSSVITGSKGNVTNGDTNKTQEYITVKALDWYKVETSVFYVCASSIETTLTFCVGTIMLSGRGSSKYLKEVVKLLLQIDNAQTQVKVFMSASVYIQ